MLYSQAMRAKVIEENPGIQVGAKGEFRAHRDIGGRRGIRDVRGIGIIKNIRCIMIKIRDT